MYSKEYIINYSNNTYINIILILFVISMLFLIIRPKISRVPGKKNYNTNLHGFVSRLHLCKLFVKISLKLIEWLLRKMYRYVLKSDYRGEQLSDERSSGCSW